jgi:uncharacterized protein involved in type VI secretion and phage assembly
MADFYGKYRGSVINTADPLQIGRIQVQVPAVTGYRPSTWAMPCVPIAGVRAGIFVVPSVGSQVWVEFEHGNADYPIWTGGFWGTMAEVPPLASISPDPSVVLQTTGQNSLVISDAAATPTSGGIILKSTNGATIVVNDTGIYISNGKGAEITLLGPTVDINKGGFTIP